MKHHILAIISIGIGLLPQSRAVAAEGVVVTLSSVGARVRAQNPDLAAARLRIDEALGLLRQSGRRSNPELEIGAEHNDRFREGKFEVGISQRFPVTDRLRLEKQVSAAQLQAAEAEIRDVERGLVAEARSAIVRILGIREQRRLGRQQAAIVKELAEFVGDASKRGELSPIDAGQAKLEAARFANQFRQLDAAEAAAIGELKPLLGISRSGTLHVGGTLPPVRSQSPGVDPSRRADWQATRSELEAAKSEVALQHANRYDDIEVGLYAAAERTEDAPDGFENEGVFGLRVKIPLPLWDKNEGNIDAAVARRQRKEKELRALGTRIHLEADAARAEMLEWAKLDAELDNTLLPLAEQQAKLAERAYRDGQGELQAVLRAREQTVQLASSRVDAQREYHLARIRWLAAAGDGQGPAKTLPDYSNNGR